MLRHRVEHLQAPVCHEPSRYMERLFKHKNGDGGSRPQGRCDRRTASTARYALRIDVERIHRGARRHEEAVAVQAAEADVGTALGQIDAPDELGFAVALWTRTGAFWHELAQVRFRQHDYGQPESLAVRSNTLAASSTCAVVAHALLDSGELLFAQQIHHFEEHCIRERGLAMQPAGELAHRNLQMGAQRFYAAQFLGRPTQRPHMNLF